MLVTALLDKRRARDGLHESLLAVYVWRSVKNCIRFRRLCNLRARRRRSTGAICPPVVAPYAPCTRTCPLQAINLCLAIHRLPSANSVTICAVFFFRPR